MINKYQEGGQLTDTQQQGLQYLAQMYAQQTGKDPQQDQQGFIQFIQQLAQQAGVQDMGQLLDMVYQQATQQAQSARRGAKLNYLKTLTNRCPEGTELMYFKAGGQVCSKCVAKKIKKEACGNKVMKGQTGIRSFGKKSKDTNQLRKIKPTEQQMYERVADQTMPKPDPKIKGVFDDPEKNRKLNERFNNPGGNKKVKKGQFGILFSEAYRQIPKVRSFVDNTVKGVSTLFNWPEGSNWIVDSETDNGDGSTTFTFIDEITGKPYPKGPVTIWNKATVPINRGRNWANKKIRKSTPKYNKNGGSLNRIPFNRKGNSIKYQNPPGPIQELIGEIT